MNEIFELSINAGPLKGEKFNLAPGVTYLVGENGAGKSQFLEAIRSGHCGIHQLGNSKAHLNNYAAFDWGLKGYNLQRGKAQGFADLNPIFERLNQIAVSQEEIGRKAETVVDKETGSSEELIRVQREPRRFGLKFEPEMLSSGTKKLIEYFGWDGNGPPLPQNRKFGPQGIRSARALIFLCDEPEHHFHPGLQKRLPSDFDNWMQKHGARIAEQGGKRPVFILAATHSPFVLTGIGQRSDHHIICLDDCKLKTQSLSPDPEETGGHVKNRIIANNLLGSGLSDFLPEPLIYAECSIETLLQGLAKKFELPVGDFFVNPGGDADGTARIKFIQEHLKALRQVTERWPESDLFSPKICYLVDGHRELGDAEEVLGADVLIKSLGVRQLEDCYPSDWINEFTSTKVGPFDDWDGEKPINQYLHENGVEGQDKGKFKCDLAQFIVEKIHSPEELVGPLEDVRTFFEEWETFSKAM